MTTLQKTFSAGLVLMSIASGGPLWADDGPRDFATQINAANGLLRGGNVDGAIAAYRQAQESAPTSSDVIYNLAVAQYRRGDVSAAAEHFRSVAAADNDAIAAKARFNLGNCDYVSALQLAEKDRPAAIEFLQSAIGNYLTALNIDPSDADARANIELASQLIDKLREKDKQEQQQQQNQNQQQQNQQQQNQQQQNQQQQNQQQQNQQQQNQQQQNQQQSGKRPDEQPQKDQPQGKQQPGQGGDQQRQEEKQQEQRNQSQSAIENENNKDKSESDKSQQHNNQSKNNESASKQQNQENETHTEPENDAAAQHQPAPSRSQQDVTKKRQGQKPTLPADELNNKEGKAPPKGKLSSARRSDKNDAHDRRTPNADERSVDGEMTAQEAEKMLQSIRDREMIRRLRRQAAERNQHISVDRDW